MRPFLLCLFLLLALLIPVNAQSQDESPDGPEAITVYLTPEEALQKAFPNADTVWSETWIPTPAERKRIERKLGWRLDEPDFTVYHGLVNGQPAGYALITEQVGLYKPITFIVKTDPKGHVESVWVMVYRESRGGEVRRQRFLSQYRKKMLDSPIRINRDIIGITGATLSVRALNAGVKKVLAILHVAYVQTETNAQ
ncbi:MAG: FMN-binding protein [bacterium]|nr:FMN-binding protein [bacterium]